MSVLVKMYVSLLPAIIAGIFNMIWCKSSFMNVLSVPIDNKIILKDKERLFGDNKTWKGFIGMIFFGVVFTIIWGYICSTNNYLTNNNYMYVNYANTLTYNSIMGALFGFAYALFELPNSFIKRRMKITPGKRISGLKGVFFVFIDQADSVIGCVIVLCLVYKMSVGMFILYILVGALTHIIINMLLYFAKLRKNMF